MGAQVLRGAPEFQKPCVPSPGRARQKQAFLGAETLKNPYKNHQMHPSVAPSDARAIAFLRWKILKIPNMRWPIFQTPQSIKIRVGVPYPCLPIFLLVVLPIT